MVIERSVKGFLFVNKIKLRMEELQLQSEDGVLISISRGALKQCQMLSAITENDVPNGIIKLQTVTAPVLTKVVEYLTAHEDDEPAEECGERLFIPKVQQKKCDLSDDDSVGGERDSEEEQEAEVDIYHNRYSGLLCAFDSRFLQSLSVPTLLEVTKAANYLGIESLLDLGCRGIAGHMKGLSTEAIRQKFNIRCDLTPEEEERIRREGLWAQDF